MTTLFFSVDIETDGPGPLTNSIRSIGVVPVLNHESGSIIYSSAPFYQRITAQSRAKIDAGTLKWWCSSEVPEAARDEIFKLKGEHIYDVLMDLRRYVEDAKVRFGGTPVFAARPSGFDFSWIYSLAHRYLSDGNALFGFRAFDMDSYAAGKLGQPFTGLMFPVEWRIPNPCPHHALEDAKVQAFLLASMLGGTIEYR